MGVGLDRGCKAAFGAVTAAMNPRMRMLDLRIGRRGPHRTGGGAGLGLAGLPILFSPHPHLAAAAGAVSWTLPVLVGGSLAVLGFALGFWWRRRSGVNRGKARDEDRWLLAIEGINDGIWDADLVNGEITLTDRCIEMLGFAPGEFRPSREEWLDRIHPDDRASQEKGMQEHIAGRTRHYNAIFRMRTKDNGYRWILSRGQVIRDRQGRAVRAVGSHSDIHAARLAEDTLEIERRWLKSTLGAMEEGVITVDLLGRIRFLNGAAERLTGWHEGAVGRSIHEACRLLGPDHDKLLQLPLDQVMGENRDIAIPPETSLESRKGERRLVEGCWVPTHGAAGEVTGAVLVFRDVTTRAQLEREQLRSSKLAAVGELAGGIAHDFNNILTVVLGNLTLAQLKMQADDGAFRWLRSAETAAVRARDLTHQLLTFAHGGDPVREAVPLPEVIREAAYFALPGAKAGVKLNLAGDAWPADVDQGQISRVIQNLVINANQAMPDGGTITIELENDQVGPESRGPLRAGCYLRITLRDTGCGIPAEHIDRIFEPYFTTKDQGTGLGLAASHSIIRKHSGHIEVESEVGKGTTFRVWLPAACSGKVEDSISMGTNNPFDPMRGKVLVMDDEESICEMAKELLERLGMTVVAATDGLAAVHAHAEACAAGEPFDVVLMDLTVPGAMGGKEALDRMRETDPNVRAIVSSGYSKDPIMADYRRHGFCGCVTKPYRLRDLARVLREHLVEPVASS